ncbi:hypothetical protein ACFYTQ_01745 [Nocardia sp. NPDC004068]|uniref:hypothetical protein n=1 Tax=Nocardia sp. NPDC004068 TaxID=3364303 RepID=UPI00369877AC
MTRTYEYKSDFARRYIAQGEAQALMVMLEALGIPVDDEARERILTCRDPDQVRLWIRRAATVDSVGALFD